MFSHNELQSEMSSIDVTISVEQSWDNRLIARDYSNPRSMEQPYSAQQFNYCADKTARQHCLFIAQWFQVRR
jgi:hypothetical protein